MSVGVLFDYKWALVQVMNQVITWTNVDKTHDTICYL